MVTLRVRVRVHVRFRDSAFIHNGLGGFTLGLGLRIELGHTSCCSSRYGSSQRAALNR